MILKTSDPISSNCEPEPTTHSLSRAKSSLLTCLPFALLDRLATLYPLTLCSHPTLPLAYMPLSLLANLILGCKVPDRTRHKDFGPELPEPTEF